MEYTNKKYSTIKTTLIFLFVLLQIVCFYPYEFVSVYYLPFPQVGGVMHLICATITCIAILMLNNRKTLPSVVYRLMLIQLFGFWICCLAHDNINMAIGQTLVFILATFLIIYIESTIGLVAFFRFYNKWIFLMAALGVLTWVLINYFSYSPIYSALDLENTNRLIDNYVFSFASNNNELSKFTYSGFFDENGAMGLWGMFALVINKLFIKEKWIEIPLICCLLFTMSLGFIVQVTVYLILFYVNRQNLYKCILIAGAAFFLFSIVTGLQNTEYDFMYTKTIGRISEIIENSNSSSNLIASDNRKELATAALKEFRENPILGTSNTSIYVGDNIYEPLALYGILGSLLIYAPFLWMIYKCRSDRNFLKGLVIIMISLFHRPFHAHLLWVFILYSIIILYIQRHKQLYEN